MICRDHSKLLFLTLWGVIYKRTFVMNAVQQKIASIICFLLRNFLGLILSFSFIFDVWLSSGLDKGHQWWNWSRHRCTSTKLYSLGWQVILAASKKHVSNGDTIPKATKPGIGMIVSGNKYVILISIIGMQPVWKLGWPWLTMARVSWFKHIPKKQVCHLRFAISKYLAVSEKRAPQNHMIDHHFPTS